MVEKAKITNLQLALLMFTTVVPTAVLFVPAVTARDARQDGWISLLVVATAYGLFVVTVITALARRFPGRSLVEYSQEILGPWLGRAVGLAYFFFFLHPGSIVVREFGDFLATAFMPETPLIVFNITILGLAAWAVRHGLEVMCRVNQFIFPLFIASIGALLILVLPEMNLSNLQPVMAGGLKPIIKGALAPAGWRGEVALAAMFLPAVNRPAEARKYLALAVVAMGVVLAWATVVTFATMGPLTARLVFPMFEVARYISIAVFLERVEAAILTLWVTGLTVKIAVFYYAAVLAAAQVLGLKDYRPLVLPVGVILASWSVLVFDNIPEMVEWLGKIWPPYAYVFELGIPALLFLLAVLRRKGGGTTRKGLILLALVLSLSLNLSTGCWSRREIETLAVVSAVGLDKVTVDGRDRYRLAVQVVRPAAVGARQQDGGQGGQGRPTWLASALGDSLYEAQQNLFTRSPRYLFLAHANIIVVGERLAREDGMEAAMDILLRHKDLRLRSWLFIARGEALEVLRAGPELERLLSQELTNMVVYTQPQASRGYRVHVKDFASYLAAPGREPVAGKLEVFPPAEEPRGTVEAAQTTTARPTKAVRLTGAAVFRRDRLIGWLGDRETMGFLFAMGEAVRGIVSLRLPGEGARPVAFLLSRASSRREVYIRDGQILASVRIRAEGDLAESMETLPVGEKETVAFLEKQAALEIRRLVEAALHRAQHELRADIFGFGELVGKRHPRQWRVLEKKWPETFTALPVQVEVEARIRRTGLIGNTLVIQP